MGSAVYWARRHWFVPVAVALALTGAVVVVSLWMHVRTLAYRYRDVAAVPAGHTAIVLGASVRRSGKPSDMLRDRLDTALELYRSGKVRKLLLTGDHGQRGYDEVNAMRRYVLANGARPADAFTDHAGFSTYESMVRARAVFGVEDAIVVTQAFHLPRAVYLARGVGLAAVGVEADHHRYRLGGQPMLREVFARVKAFADLQLARRPRFLGPRVDINGDGRVSWDRDRARRGAR